MKRAVWPSAAVGAMLMIAAWLTYAPTALGGPLEYVIVSGTSMEPTLRSGDLVVLRPSGSYEPGDVVGYHSATLGRTVLHRIVQQQGDRFVLQGDNNRWKDTDRPLANQIMGRQWVRVPGMGRMLRPLQGTGQRVGVAGVVLIGALARRSRRKAHRPEPSRFDGQAVDTRRSRVLGPRIDDAVLTWVARGALVVFLALSLLAFAVPLSKHTTTQVPLQHTGRFEYFADAPVGPVYEGPTLGTGDPVFLRLVDEMTIAFEYQLEAPAIESLEGTASLSMTVSDANGWTHAQELLTPAAFHGDRVILQGRLDLRALQLLTQNVERLTGVAPGAYVVTVTPDIAMRGSLEGTSFDERFVPGLTFRMDALHLWLPEAASATAHGPDAFSPAQRSVVDLPGTAPSDVTVFGLTVQLAHARVLACLGTALALLALVWANRRARSYGLLEEPERIRLQYGSWLMAVTGALEMEGAIDVATIEDLVRLAEQHGLPILAAHQDEQDVYQLRLQGQIFVYRGLTGANDAEVSAEPAAPLPVADPDQPARPTAHARA